MTLAQFQSSLNNQTPPAVNNDYLLALWHDAKGDWNASHDIAQDIPTREGDWIHAYLHRKEGDQWNAGYWYRRAGRTMPDYSLEKEWEELVEYFLGIN